MDTERDGLPITKEGAQPKIYSGWNACYKMTVNGKQYGRWICWPEFKDGLFPPELRGSNIYKKSPKMLYAQSKKDYEEIMRGNL